MNINQSTLRAAKNELQPILGKMLKEAEIDPSSDINFKDEVISRYQPTFSPEIVASISEEEFKSFLLIKNNHHWSGLHRAGGIITSNMDLLRAALSILVNEQQPIEDRLDKLIPKTGSMVPRLGRAVITAVLTVTYPELYGAMNNTTEAGMRALGIWPSFERGASFGERYSEVNEILTWLTKELHTDFWTLDALWWAVKSSQNGPEGPIIGDEEVMPRFGLEKYLQAFLCDNWDNIENFKDWALYEEDGDIVGYEYNTGEIGRIDLLAHHKTEPKWIVIELKREQGSDQTLGQVQRYMGWVMKNLADKNERVEGLIICQTVDASLHYALEPSRDISLLTYEVDFHLHPPE